MQMESIYIMAKRQIKLFYRSKPRVLGSIAQPTLFLLAFGFGFGPVFEQAGEADYTQFLTPGIIGMSLLFGSMMNGSSIIWDKRFGFLKETLVAPVSRTSLLVGRCLGAAITSMLQGLLVFALSFLLLGFRVSHLWAVFPFIGGMLVVAFMFTLLGTVIAIRIDDMQAFPIIMNFIMLPMFFLSGALFPVENLPDFAITVTTFNPMTHSVNLLRDLITFNFSAGSLVNASVLFALIIVLLAIGRPLFKNIKT